MTYRYQARQARRDKNAAWAIEAQARLKAWEAQQAQQREKTR